MLKKLSLIIPLLALIALLVWWFTPHYTEEDEAYYRAVFCIKEAKALINGGKYREIILNFDIDADDFFSLASHSAGTKISIADRNDRSPVESAK